MESQTAQSQSTADRLYSFLVEEEDARVCRDIPPDSCTNVPENFFKIGASQTLTKLADELSSAKTVLPWVLGAVGAPSALIGFLVPIRESGSLLPQLFIAAAVRRRPLRKQVWALGAVLQALALVGMGIATLMLRGPVAGAVVLSLLIAFSLARGLVSVASKDVTGKTVPKTRRGRLTGFTTALSGILTLFMGLLLTIRVSGEPTAGPLVMLLGSAAVLWGLAGGVFSTVKETPGATDGGANAIREALARLDLLRTDRPFRHFVGVRALLISTGLAAPFYVALARESSGGMGLLGSFVLASGLAAALASGFWGRFADRSSRKVLISAATIAATLGVMVFLADMLGLLSQHPWLAPLAFFCLSIAHSGTRVGRKTYLLDMAGGSKRTDYVAVSNSVIGVVLLLGGAVGFLTPVVGPSGVLLVLSLMGFSGALWGTRLPDTQ